MFYDVREVISLQQRKSAWLRILKGFVVSHASLYGRAQVFYYKMKGDYFRYLSEFERDSARDKAAEESLNAYKAASGTALVTAQHNRLSQY
jgi:hypothetical protein